MAKIEKHVYEEGDPERQVEAVLAEFVGMSIAETVDEKDPITILVFVLPSGTKAMLRIERSNLIEMSEMLNAVIRNENLAGEN